MKTISLLLLCLVCGGAHASSLVGLWVPPGGDAIVELVVENQQGLIRIVEVLDEDLNDEENPAPRLRSRPLRGITLGEGFSVKQKEWRDGTIYDPDSGKTYRAILKHMDDSHLEVRGFIASPLFGKSQIWTSFEHFSRNMKRILAAGEAR